MYTLLIALIYLAFISLGLPDSLLGSGWPVIHAELDVPVSYMGIISMTISGGTIISSLVSDRVTKKFGTCAVTAASTALTALGLFGFGLSDSFWMLIVSSLPYGLGAGAIDAALNNYVALHYSSRHMSWLHCFWGVGTIASPFIMSYAIANMTWHAGYMIVGCIQLAIAVLIIATRPVWKATARGETQARRGGTGLKSALMVKGVPFLLIAFFAYCAADATAMYWASTYFAEVKAIGAERAAQFASLFYIGMTAGRFVSGFVTDRLGDRKMIAIGTCILTVGIIVLFLPIEGEAAALSAFIVIGLGCAPIYPSIIHSTPSNFGLENSGAIIGIQMASAYVGSTFIPPLFGLLGNHLGFGIMPAFLIVFFALMIVMAELTFRTAAKRSDGNEK